MFPGSEKVQEWMHLIYDQALLAQGSPLEDPTAFAKRLTKLFSTASAYEDDLVANIYGELNARNELNSFRSCY